LKIADIAMPVTAAPSGAAGGGAVQAAVDGAAAEDAPPPAAEKAILTVKLESFEASAKAKIIREVKALLGCNLVEAKTMVEKAPTVLKENVVKDVRAFYRAISDVTGCKESQGDNGEAGRKDYFAIEYIHCNENGSLSSTVRPIIKYPIVFLNSKGSSPTQVN
jgi:ribosomal protein L7/L12